MRSQILSVSTQTLADCKLATGVTSCKAPVVDDHFSTSDWGIIQYIEGDVFYHCIERELQK